MPDSEHDEWAIEKLLVRYATAIDTRDMTLLRSCFTADLDADYDDIGTWSTADELVEFMDAAHQGFGRTQHMITNAVVQVDGDTATSRSYVHAVLVLAEDPHQWFDTVGQYDDRLVRTAEGWRIAARRFAATRMTAGRS